MTRRKATNETKGTTALELKLPENHKNTDRTVALTAGEQIPLQADQDREKQVKDRLHRKT